MDIAVIGMSALFPKAKNLSAYWQNILDRVNGISEASDQWALPYYNPQSTKINRIHTRKGGFLEHPIYFDPTKFKIMPSSVSGSDPDHFLGLKLAQDALYDAGYEKKEFDRERTGIVLGWGNYIKRGIMNSIQHCFVLEQTLDIIKSLCPDMQEQTFKKIHHELEASLIPLTKDCAAGLIPNAITGRIANRLNLMGPNFIVDAACASSLIALKMGIQELELGQSEMMLVGGINLAISPLLYMFFQRLGALSNDDICPFDQKASGTLLGEGAGILVIKSLEKAIFDKDRIYAVIKGMGCSSDGKGIGILAPRLEGQVLALKRAYEKTKIHPSSIDLLEAHGTGTRIGDETEIKCLREVFGERKNLWPQAGLGSVKSMIGHCMSAAGIAGLIKCILALYHKVLPPTLCETPNPSLGLEKTSFYLNTHARPWIRKGSKRRAAVNSFGFGGINTHAILEEFSEDTKEILHKKWKFEICVFSAQSQGELLETLDYFLLEIAKKEISLADLAYTLSQNPHQIHRLAIVAKSMEDLESKIKEFQKIAKKERNARPSKGIYYNQTPMSGKIVFMFPGEGSQYANMLDELCICFPKVRSWFDLLDQVFQEDASNLLLFPPSTNLEKHTLDTLTRRLEDQDIATQTTFIASHAMFDLIKSFSIPCDFMVGHSNGEWNSLVASETLKPMSEKKMIEKMRQKLMIHKEVEKLEFSNGGKMLAIGGILWADLCQILKEKSIFFHTAMINSPNQIILFTYEKYFASIQEIVSAQNGFIFSLGFSKPYHTPLYQKAEKIYKEHYRSLELQKGNTIVYSCATSKAIPDDKELAQKLLSQQWCSPVNFQKTIENLYEKEARIFIEIGPSNHLTAFVKDTLREKKDILSIASNLQQKNSLEQFLHMLAHLYVNQIPIDFSPLYIKRLLQKKSFAEDQKKGNIRSNRISFDLPKMKLKSQEQLQDHSRIQEIEEKSEKVFLGHFSLMDKFFADQKEIMELFRKNQIQDD